MKLGRRASPTWDARVEIGIVDVLLAKMQLGLADLVEAPVGLGLDRLVLEHRLGDEIACRERVERDRRGDPREGQHLVFRLEEAARDAAVEHPREAVERRRQNVVRAVGQHHLVPGEGEDESNLRPHQPGPDNPYFLLRHSPNSVSFRGRPTGGTRNPCTPAGVPGFRVRRCAPPRNDRRCARPTQPQRAANCVAPKVFSRSVSVIGFWPGPPASTARPRCTAGRAAISPYQRCIAGYWSSWT